MPYATAEEQRLIEQMIFLPLVKKVLVHNTKILATFTKCARPYVTFSEKVFRAVSQDLHIVKRELHRRNIKVFEESRDHTSIVYKAYVRGYEEIHRYAFVMLKNKTEDYLEKYMHSHYEQTEKLK